MVTRPQQPLRTSAAAPFRRSFRALGCVFLIAAIAAALGLVAIGASLGAGTIGVDHATFDLESIRVLSANSPPPVAAAVRGQPGCPPTTTVNGGAERNRYYEVLVLVIAGDFSDGTFAGPYAWFRNVWAKVTEECKKRDMPIRFYFLSMDPDVDEVTVGEDTIRFPGKNRSAYRIPGILDMTISSMEYIRQEELPGHRHNKTLRTNLSSFWRFDRYLQYINENLPSTGLYHGYPQSNVGFRYINGAQILLSYDMETVLLENKDKIDFGLIDDVAIGAFMLDMGVTLQRGKFFIAFIHRQDLPAAILSDPPDDHYVFRLKERHESPTREQDVMLMSYLFFRYYGSTPVNLTAFSVTPAPAVPKLKAEKPKPGAMKMAGNSQGLTIKGVKMTLDRGKGEEKKKTA